MSGRPLVRCGLLRPHLLKGFAVAGATALVLSCCGGTSETPAGSSAIAGPPTEADGSGQMSKLADLNEACQKNTQDLARGSAVYPTHLDMVVGNETQVRAAITLAQGQSPQEVLGQPSISATALSVIAACFVNASLDASPDAFSLHEEVPATPQQVSAGHDASWRWSVTPKRAGHFSLTLSLWPVLPSDSATGASVPPNTAQVTPETIDVSVTTPLGVNLQEKTTAVTDWLTLAGKLLGAMAIMLGSAWGLRRAWRKRSASDDQPTPNP